MRRGQKTKRKEKKRNTGSRPVSIPRRDRPTYTRGTYDARNYYYRCGRRDRGPALIGPTPRRGPTKLFVYARPRACTRVHTPRCVLYINALADVRGPPPNCGCVRV